MPVLAAKRSLWRTFLPPKRAVYLVLTSQGGSLVCFANQEGTLACVFQQFTVNIKPTMPLIKYD